MSIACRFQRSIGRYHTGRCRLKIFLPFPLLSYVSTLSMLLSVSEAGLPKRAQSIFCQFLKGKLSLESPPGFNAHLYGFAGIRKQNFNLLGDSSGIRRWDQKAVLIVDNQLRTASAVRDHNGFGAA